MRPPALQEQALEPPSGRLRARDDIPQRTRPRYAPMFLVYGNRLWKIPSGRKWFPLKRCQRGTFAEMGVEKKRKTSCKLLPFHYERLHLIFRGTSKRVSLACISKQPGLRDHEDAPTKKVRIHSLTIASAHVLRAFRA